MSSKRFSLKKRYYLILVSRDENGSVRKFPIPLQYMYAFVAVAVIGAFTVTGLAGSYSRMLIKTARFNQLRTDHDALQKDYANLEKQSRQKDVQAASLGSLANEVSALYGLTASKLAGPMGHLRPGARAAAAKDAKATLVADSNTGFTDDNYNKSMATFNSLLNSGMSGAATQMIDGVRGLGTSLPGVPSIGGIDAAIDAPSLWPVIGPIRSGFGQREDPILGNGEGEFHTGIDIDAPVGTPVRATADGIVRTAAWVNGYGRQVVIDHGQNVSTGYAHLSGFAVMAGQSVVRGQVIGYVGATGRTTGPNLHYEVRIRNTPVNPHKYLRETIAGLGSNPVGGS